MRTLKFKAESKVVIIASLQAFHLELTGKK